MHAHIGIERSLRIVTLANQSPVDEDMIDAS
jgi:hypothetical protein